MKGWSLPWAGITVAVGTCAAMTITGANAGLALAVLILWLGTLWLSRP